MLYLRMVLQMINYFKLDFTKNVDVYCKIT